MASLIKIIKPIPMNIDNQKHTDNMLLKVVRNFINMFTKSPDEYPVKYYKKSKNYSRDRHARLLL